MNAYIKAGHGFDVGANFARAKQDTPIEIDDKATALSGYVVGTIAGNPDSALGFMRDARVRVHVQKERGCIH